MLASARYRWIESLDFEKFKKDRQSRDQNSLTRRAIKMHDKWVCKKATVFQSLAAMNQQRRQQRLWIYK